MAERKKGRPAARVMLEAIIGRVWTLSTSVDALGLSERPCMAYCNCQILIIITLFSLQHRGRMRAEFHSSVPVRHSHSSRGGSRLASSISIGCMNVKDCWLLPTTWN